MYHRCVTTMFVDRGRPDPRHFKARTPMVFVPYTGRFLGDVIAIVNHNRDFGEPEELRQRNFLPVKLAEKSRGFYRFGQFSLGKEETAVGFVGHHSFNPVIFDGGKPARTATLRMGDKDAISDLIEQRRNGVRDYIGIKASGIRRHLPEELFQRRCILWKLHIRKVIGIIADPELGKPELLIRSGGYTCRHGAPSGIPAPGLVDQIYTETAPQENMLESFAAIRSGFPCFF